LTRVIANASGKVADFMKIIPYDAQWPAAFQEERARIALALGGVATRIDHHGSTAVPGLAAKPIIDIQVSVRDLRQFGSYAIPLAALGYFHVAHADDARCPFFHRPASWPHTHHIHVVEAGGIEERDTLAFRDYLRANRDVAAAYAALKVSLSPLLGSDADGREEYARRKTTFVTNALKSAIEAGFPRSVPE
jgi:GrpB-like predicted nucleotidyltransferase (UPF0157 family)